MNTKPIIVVDFETTSSNPHSTEICQIAAVAIHARRLTIGESFNSYVQVLDKSKIEAKALEVNNITIEQIDAAPHPKQVWQDFSAFINRYNFKKNSFFAPIIAGYNITGFDLPILQRYCESYGPVDKDGKQALFSNFVHIDLMHMLWQWTENTADIPNLKLTTIREWMGLSCDGAHNALNDVTDTARILVKMLKMYRYQYPKIPFKGAFV